MTYYDYYPKPKPARPVKDGIKAKSRTGRIGEKWWSQKFLLVIEQSGIGARLGRGKTYARKGQVINIEFNDEGILSLVQGSSRKPYSIVISFQKFTKSEWNKIIETLAKEALFTASLLAGEMPFEIYEVLQSAGISLFPTKKTELKTTCSCPDWSNPCKHIAAVFYILAERFDEDPFMIFKLRGMEKPLLLSELRVQRKVAPVSGEMNENAQQLTESLSLSKFSIEVPPLSDSMKNFFECGETIENFSLSFSQNGGADGLKRLGASPFVINQKDLALELLPVYDIARNYVMSLMEEGTEQSKKT